MTGAYALLGSLDTSTWTNGVWQRPHEVVGAGESSPEHLMHADP